jgi:hydroxymethylpyrimidine/phosphomethylpyrimidine kinase
VSLPSTPVALTIAGSDSSGGAGIQADLKTFSALGVYGASVITAITAQNTFGVQGVAPVTTRLVAQQIRSVLADLKVGAIKTGMLHNEKIIAVLCAALQKNKIPLVVDPVMVATSGDLLLSPKANKALKTKLLPLATLLTPNLEEAAVLLDCAVAKNLVDMENQAKALLALGCQAVLIKGGHLASQHSADILVSKNFYKRFAYERINTPNTHGTGCTLSAAIAAYLAQGTDLLLAVTAAREYLFDAITQADELQISKKITRRRHGPVHHFYRNW